MAPYSMLLLFLVTFSTGSCQRFQDDFPVQRGRDFGGARESVPRSIGGRQPVFQSQAQEIDFEPAPPPPRRQPPPPSAFAGSFQTTTQRPIAKIVKQINQQNQDGSYTFGYESQDGSFRVETRGLDGLTKGKYGYLDQNGELKEVEYTAGGQFGYEPSGAGIMVPPRAPPRKSKGPFDDDEDVEYDDDGNPIRPVRRGPVATQQQLPQFQRPQSQTRHQNFQAPPHTEPLVRAQPPPPPQQQQPPPPPPPPPAATAVHPQQSLLPRRLVPQQQRQQQQQQQAFSLPALSQFSPSSPVARETFSGSPEIQSQQHFSFPEADIQPAIPVAPPARHRQQHSPLNDFFAQQRQRQFK